MNPFREKTPSRRPDRAECEHYSSYKDTLREDFNKRCGYCDDSDGFRIRSYTIDHFVPRNPKDFTHDIKPNYYYNLVWACSFCNLAKSNKWFTKDGSIHNDREIGFIEPTSEEYTNLFKRNKDGQIICNGVNQILAEHIIFELKLWYPLHRTTWRLEKLFFLEEIISDKIQNVADQNLVNEFKELHYEILIFLKNSFRELFAENE